MNYGLCWDTDLPRAETLEEEVESEAPNHGGEQDAHQRQTLDPLAASQLGNGWKIQIWKEFPLWLHLNEERECKRKRHLHDDVEGKVEQQVADADRQQVGGEVVGSLNEAVSSSASRGRQIKSISHEFVFSLIQTWVNYGLGSMWGLLRF